MIGWKPKYYDPMVASVRYRCLSPLRELRRRGLDVELYSEARWQEYSAIIFSKLYDDANRSLAKRFKESGKTVILDICDNHFYNPYNLEKFERVRTHLIEMLQLADIVITSTEALAEVLTEESRLNLSPVVIGDAIEEGQAIAKRTFAWWDMVSSFVERRKIREERVFRLLWFGIHGGENAPYGMKDILTQKELLIKVSRQYPIELVVLSNSREKYLRLIRPLPFPTRYYEWGTISLARLFQRCKINIIPISKNPFTLCKTNNRLASALYMGLPTIADEIPSYRDLAPFCVLDEWDKGFERYITDHESARRQAGSSRQYITSHYSMDRLVKKWIAVLSRWA